nr:hypothetical protein [Candidatus Woesearchaeota archaeon]
MTKRVVFFEKDDALSINIRKQIGEELSKKKILETYSYLECLVDQKIITDLHFQRIKDRNDIGYLAWGDKGLIKILKKVKIQDGYCDAYKAEVLDEGRLNSIIGVFGSRYGLQYRIYEYQGNASPKKAEAMFYEISEGK